MKIPSNQPHELNFRSLRRDWYAGADLMARALQRELSPSCSKSEFVGFPRHWIPLFEWAGARWSNSCAPSNYVPFFSGKSESAVVSEVNRAREHKQLRLLVELAASTDVVICETLQRIDGRKAHENDVADRITLTTWHGYSRRELIELDDALASYRVQKKKVVFLPCSRSRPYDKSQSYKRYISNLVAEGIVETEFEKIVLTSIGPIPEQLWRHETVQRYDTGVRDLYRLLVQLRRLLADADIVEAWDFLPLVQYGDLLDILSAEGALPELRRPKKMRRRHIPIYRPRQRGSR